MPVINLTTAKLESLPHPEDLIDERGKPKSEVIYWHDDNGGDRDDAEETYPARLALKCRNGGARTWIVEMRFDGEKFRNTYGSPDSGMTLREAIRQRDLDRAKMMEGENPRRSQRTAPAQDAKPEQAKTVSSLIKEYFADLDARLTRGELRRGYVVKLKKRLGGKDGQGGLAAVWGRKPVKSIGKTEIHEFLNQYDATPAMQEAMHGHIDSLFSFWVGRTTGAAHPEPREAGKRKQKRGSHNKRKRFLSPGELARLLPKLPGIGTPDARLKYPGGHILALMLLTARRYNEVARAEWGEFDTNRKTWRLPGDPKERAFPNRDDGNGVAKNGQAHALPLTPLALAILEDARKHRVGDDGRFVFHLPGDDEQPTDNIRAAMDAAREVAALSTDRNEEREQRDDFTPHDLRRTCATMLESLGAPDGVVKVVLNHADERGTSAIYMRIMNEPTLRLRLLREWLGKLEERYMRMAKIGELLAVRQSRTKLIIGRHSGKAPPKRG